MDCVNAQIVLMYRYIKLILENRYLLKKIIDFDRNIKKITVPSYLQIKNQSYFPVFPAVLGNMSISSRFFTNPGFIPIMQIRHILIKDHIYSETAEPN
jgi:hypothetical protein